jgi:hypothetical protein
VVDKEALEQDFFGFPVNVIPPWLSVLIYNLGMKNNGTAGGRSSETSSHFIDMDNNSLR